jgi:hypothetical protein
MDKFFQRAEDKNVAAVAIYEKSGETKAYKDAACTQQFYTSELKNAFIKGSIIVLASSAGYVIPVKYAESSSVGSVYYIKPNSTTATSADIGTLAALADPS